MRLLTNYIVPGQVPAVTVMVQGPVYYLWRAGTAPQLPNGADVRGLWGMRLMKALPNTMAQLTFVSDRKGGLTDATLLGIIADHLEQTNSNPEALDLVKQALTKLTS